MSQRPYKHYILKGDGDQPYYWHTKAGNGEVVASSHDQYIRRSDCLHGLNLFKDHTAEAPINDRTASGAPGRLADYEFEIDKNRRDEWIWRFQAPNNKIVATGSEGYSSKQAVLDAIERVKEHVPDAEVFDETGEPVDLEECSGGGLRPPRARRYRIRVDRQKYVVDRPSLTGGEILEVAGKIPPAGFQLYQKVRGQKAKPIALDESVDLTCPGVERFQTMPKNVTDGGCHDG